MAEDSPAPDSPDADNAETISEMDDSLIQTEKASDYVTDDNIESDIQGEYIEEEFNDFTDLSESETGESDECGVAYLLSRNTPSFRCLAQVALSNSSLMREKLYHFPPLEDPGIDEAYFYQEPMKSYDNVGVEKYQDTCKDLKIFPLSSVKKHLPHETMNLKYYVLTPKQMQATCETLAGNAHVENFILEGNHMIIEQIEMLRDMLAENSAIKYLNLRECRIGEDGAKILSDGIGASQVLAEVDLSYNSLGNKGLHNLLNGLIATTTLVKINLGNNNLTEESAETLEKILLRNDTIKEIDLSWNFYNTAPACKRIFNTFLNRDSITHLNLSWNGIGASAAVRPLARYISRSIVLQHLDISYNRLTGPPLRRIRGSILRNHSLISVNIGNNPCTVDEAYFVASLLLSKANDPLQYLGMENILFTKEIVPLLQKIKNLRKRIKIGGILYNFVIKGPDTNLLLFKRCQYLLMKPKKKKAKIDFGQIILQLPEEVITKQEFETFLKKRKVKRLDKELLTGLMDKFTVRKTRIDCVEMRKAYMKLFPDTTLPPPKQKKKKEKKKKGKGKKKKGPETEIAVHDLEGQAEIPSTEGPKTDTPVPSTTIIEPPGTRVPSTVPLGPEKSSTGPPPSKMPSAEIPRITEAGSEITRTESLGLN